ncbi:MAG: hypothetical protein ACSHX3_05960 [Litorimonas sp.]
MNLDFGVKVAQIIVTVCFGIAAIIVSFQQLKISKIKQRLELYDRRLKILSVVQEYVSKCLNSNDFSTFDVVEFRQFTAEAKFLFGSDLNTEIERLISIGYEIDLQIITMKEMIEAHVFDKSQNPAREKLKLTRSMRSSYERIIEIFGKYLNLNE